MIRPIMRLFPNIKWPVADYDRGIGATALDLIDLGQNAEMSRRGALHQLPIVITGGEKDCSFKPLQNGLGYVDVEDEITNNIDLVVRSHDGVPSPNQFGIVLGGSGKASSMHRFPSEMGVGNKVFHLPYSFSMKWVSSIIAHAMTEMGPKQNVKIPITTALVLLNVIVCGLVTCLTQRIYKTKAITSINKIVGNSI